MSQYSKYSMNIYFAGRRAVENGFERLGESDSEICFGWGLMPSTQKASTSNVTDYDHRDDTVGRPNSVSLVTVGTLPISIMHNMLAFDCFYWIFKCIVYRDLGSFDIALIKRMLQRWAMNVIRQIAHGRLFKFVSKIRFLPATIS